MEWKQVLVLEKWLLWTNNRQFDICNIIYLVMDLI